MPDKRVVLFITLNSDSIEQYSDMLNQLTST